MTTASKLDPAFQDLGEVFDRLSLAQTLGGLAFSVTVDGEHVVDLWAGEASPGRPWALDTAVCTMSVAKGMAGLCAAMLVDRGCLEVDAPVARYWPEFSRHGKAGVTVRHVLLHQAGVLGLPDVRATLGSGAEAWLDLDAIAAALADARLAWRPGTRMGYHAQTYGWLLGELVRRTDGRTLGTFFRQEVAEPLGVATAIGIDHAAFVALATPHLAGVTTAEAGAAGRLLLGSTNKRARDTSTLLGQALLSDGATTLVERAAELLREPDWLRAEVPSSNGVTSAHDLARVFAVLALRGEVGGVRLLGEPTLASFLAPSVSEPDVVLLAGLSPLMRLVAGRRLRMSKTLGWTPNVVRNGWGPFGPSQSAVGAGGLGGQFAIADPERRVSAAFVRSEYTHDASAQEQLLRALYRCLPVSP